MSSQFGTLPAYLLLSFTSKIGAPFDEIIERTLVETENFGKSVFELFQQMDTGMEINTTMLNSPL